MNKTYEKIKNVLSFGSTKDKTITYTKEFEFLKRLKYYATEKLDGTNIRLYYDGYNTTIHGRTEKSELPKGFLEKFNKLYDLDIINSQMEELFGDKEVVIYGEGIGEKIQADGEKYVKDGIDFVVFDILVNDVFLDRENVEKITENLGLKIVDVVIEGDLEEIINFVKEEQKSIYNSNHIMEGVVAKPLIPLYFKDETRVCFKIKYLDFLKLKKQEREVQDE